MFVALVAVLLGWRESLLRETRRQREAMDRFENSGGEFKYHAATNEFGTITIKNAVDDPDQSNGHHGRNGWPAGDRRELAPDWAYYPLVYDTGSLITTPTRIGLFSEGTDAGFVFAATPLTSLHEECRPGYPGRVTDTGLGYLAKLPKLEALSRYEGHGLRAWALRQLSACPSLLSLDVSETGITDDGLVALISITSLRVLRLAGTRVTDNGMRSLECLQNLRELDLNGTQVGDGGLLELQGLPTPHKGRCSFQPNFIERRKELGKRMPGLTVDFLPAH